LIWECGEGGTELAFSEFVRTQKKRANASKPRATQDEFDKKGVKSISNAKKKERAHGVNTAAGTGEKRV